MIIKIIIIPLKTTVQTQECTYFAGRTVPQGSSHPRNPDRGIPHRETQPERVSLREEQQSKLPKVR